MSTVDALPPDQRAVLQLVLQRGRSYDEIATLLSIDRAAVRQRALDALDALAPEGAQPPAERALITDYLLGQLPERVAGEVVGYLASSPADREWALTVSTQLSQLTSGSLPEIPVGTPLGADAESGDEPPSGEAPPEAPPAAQPPQTRPARAPVPAPMGLPEPRPAAGPSRSEQHPGQRPSEPSARREPERPRQTAAASPPRPPRQTPPPAEGGRGSRRGGAILLSAIAIALVAAAVILLTTGGSSTPQPTASTSSSTPSSSTPTSSTTGSSTGSSKTSATGTSTTTAKPKLLAALNLTSPSGSSNTVGVAQVIREAGVTGIVVDAQGMPANTAHDAYAVWLYSSPSSSKLVGFVPNLVGKNGKLKTEGKLPSDAAKYGQLLITLETHSNPKTPGQVVLSGPFREHS